MLSKLFRVLLGLLVVIAVAYVILILLAKRAPDHTLFSSGPPRPWVIAHQGGDGLWPSNTMYAFERAAELGVDMLEMDLHSTADGVLVLMHDDTVDQTTDGTGPINNYTLVELKVLDAGYDWSQDGGQSFPYRGQGITVPTLEEVLTAFDGWLLNIEIKQTEPSIVAPFCQMIRDYRMAGSVLVGSFDQEALNLFRQECPEVATSAGEADVRTFYVLDRLYLEAIYSPTSNALQVPEFSDDLHVITKRFVDGAHGRDMEVHAWTINEEQDMQRMLDLGVDGIITDYPDRLLVLLDR